LIASSTLNYSLARLQISSELPLPGLVECRDFSGDGLLIRRATVPSHLSSTAATFANGQYSEDEFLLDVPDVARYLVRNCDEILVDQVSTSTDRDVCTFLLGTVFGVLFHKLGMPPLHASVVEVEDGCVAFVGDSGAGKSTLAAGFAMRGYPLISDDVCFLELGDRNGVKLWPGVSRMRLWEDAVMALGFGGSGLEKETRGRHKYIIPSPLSRDPLKPSRLRRVYRLDPALNGCTSFSAERVRGSAAIEILLQNIYRLSLAELLGYKSASFIVCGVAARDVSVFRFTRPFQFEHFEQGIDFLEKHLRQTT
jgi:hypothetical protein